MRVFEPQVLGAFSVFFTAFIVANILPGMLYLQPTRVAALKVAPGLRLRILPRSIAVGLPFGLLAGVITPMAGLLALSDLSAAELAPLAITSCLLTGVSSVQDHLRGTLHLSELSWHAAAVSAVQLFAVCVCVVLMDSTLNTSWVPFGALGIANCISLGFGTWRVRRQLFIGDLRLPKTFQLMREGWPIFWVSVVPFLTRLFAAGLVASFYSLDAVGHYEASRVVASPVYVASLGIAQALSPSLMQAGFSRRQGTSFQPRLVFMLAFVPISLCYAALVGLPSAFNPMQQLIPLAYAQDGLVLMALAAVVVPYLAMPFRAEIVGAGKSKDLIVWVFVSALLHLAVVAATIRTFGAFAIPLGIVAGGVVETVAAWRAANRLYVRAAGHSSGRRPVGDAAQPDRVAR